MVQQLSATSTMLKSAKQLVEEIESGNSDAANEILEELGSLRERYLFQEIGKLTRDLHNALTGFHADSRMASLAEKDIPDAKERLNYVITMTEEAANRSLNAVETGIPISENLKKQAENLQNEWNRFREKNMSADEFRILSKEIDEFFPIVQTEAAKIHENLSDVLMAQDFQDLTGQVIRRVINLVNEVEDNLVNLIRVSGESLGLQAAAGKPAVDSESHEERIKAVGPAVPGVDISDIVTGQDEVDDLLSSLGF